MELDWTLLAPLMGGTAALIGALVGKEGLANFWAARTEKSTHKHWARVARANDDLYALLDKAILATPADRAILCVAHNGGKDVRAFTPSYLTIMAESTGDALPDVRDRFAKFPLDRTYYKYVIQPLAERGGVELRPGDLPEKYWLRDLYDTQKVKIARCFRISATKKRKYFLILNSTSARSLEASDRDAINQCLEGMRRLKMK